MTTFVAKDLAILKKKMHVHLFHFQYLPKRRTPLEIIRQLFDILSHWRKIDAFVCQFAGYPAFWPVLLGRIFSKPCLIVAAGTESARLDSIAYGDFRHPLVSHFTRFALKHATHIAPVHRSLMGFDYTYYNEKQRRQGADAFVSNFKTPYTEIFYGFDGQKFIDMGLKRIPNSFMTIASGFEQDVVFKRKGLDLITYAAESHPDWKFTIVGYRAIPTYVYPSNVELVSTIPQEKLIELFNRHEFYCQVSRFEGFPNALAEAMLCGCIPVGSNVTAIPEMIDVTGLVLEKHDMQQFEALLEKCAHLDNKAELSRKARARILLNYPTELRELRLLETVNKLIR